MKVLLITTDLLAASQLEGAAAASGATVTSAPPKKAVEKAEAIEPGLVVLELASPLGDMAGLVAGLKSLSPAPAVIAFGPHVQEAKLQAAADAGCDAVLTRGQFHRQAAEIIARYASPTAGGSSSK